MERPKDQRGPGKAEGTKGAEEDARVEYRLSRFSGSETIILVLVGAIFMAAFMVVLRLRMPESLADLSAVLFGAASLGMVFLSFLVALLAIFGWQELRGRVERVTTAEIARTKATLRSEMAGRTHAGLGLMFGRICRKAPDRIDTDRLDLLDFAISHSAMALSLYGEMADPPEKSVLGVSNNLAFYLAMRGRPEDRDRCLSLARGIWRDAVNDEDVNRQLTCCFARLRFSRDREDREEARRVLRQVIETPLGSKREQDEAAAILTAFQEQLRLDEGRG